MTSIPANSPIFPTSPALTPEDSFDQPNPISTFSNSPSGFNLTSYLASNVKTAAGSPTPYFTDDPGNTQPPDSGQNPSGPPPDTNDLGKTMDEIQKKDPGLASDLENADQRGDGNEMALDIDKAYKKGDISKHDAEQLEEGVQSEANAKGGGKINEGTRKQIANDFGEDDLITGGHERTFAQAFEQTTGISL
jgi:hypothetical protein